MREIKFRAWDEKEKCWVSGFAIHQSGMFSDWAGCKKINGQCVAEADWKYQHEIPHIKIMQYTGLKDRHGQEIYEGDILRDDEMGLNVVRWEDGSFWLEMFYEGGQSLMEHLSDYNEVCEVIGNIYENPELLKGEKNA